MYFKYVDFYVLLNVFYCIKVLKSISTLRISRHEIVNKYLLKYINTSNTTIVRVAVRITIRIGGRDGREVRRFESRVGGQGGGMVVGQRIIIHQALVPDHPRGPPCFALVIRCNRPDV